MGPPPSAASVPSDRGPLETSWGAGRGWLWGLLGWCLWALTCQRGRGLGEGGGRGGWAGVLPAPRLGLERACSFPTVQPDPPVNVTVTAVPGNPRWLRVTWRDPPSWNSYFYRLQFELRYRAERSKTFTTWMVSSPSTSGRRRALGPRGQWEGSGKNNAAPGPALRVAARVAVGESPNRSEPPSSRPSGRNDGMGPSASRLCVGG